MRVTPPVRATVVTVWSALSAQRWQALSAWFDDTTLGRGDVEARGTAFTDLMLARAVGTTTVR